MHLAPASCSSLPPSASRMESHGLPGHVHLSDAAYGAMRAAKVRRQRQGGVWAA